jgi:hypothetical protein
LVGISLTILEKIKLITKRVGSCIALKLLPKPPDPSVLDISIWFNRTRILRINHDTLKHFRIAYWVFELTWRDLGNRHGRGIVP